MWRILPPWPAYIMPHSSQLYLPGKCHVQTPTPGSGEKTANLFILILEIDLTHPLYGFQLCGSLEIVNENVGKAAASQKSNVSKSS